MFMPMDDGGATAAKLTAKSAKAVAVKMTGGPESQATLKVVSVKGTSIVKTIT